MSNTKMPIETRSEKILGTRAAAIVERLEEAGINVSYTSDPKLLSMRNIGVTTWKAIRKIRPLEPNYQVDKACLQRDAWREVAYELAAELEQINAKTANSSALSKCITLSKREAYGL